MPNNLNRKLIAELLTATGLVGLAIAWRIFNHQTMAIPNLELITAVSLVAAVTLRRPIALAVPLAILLISDVIIGNSSIAWFTWSAFIIIALAGSCLKRFQGQDGRLLLASAGTGLGGGLFFFAWTNFGVWALGDGTFYPHTLAGLVNCYIMGLPFIKGTLISGIVITPLVMAATIYLPKLLTITKKQLTLAN